jgi:acetyl-CoA acyltransferase
MREVVIVDSVRTGLAKSFRGKFNMTRPDDMAAHCVNALLSRNDLDPKLVEDCIVGAGSNEGAQGYNIGRNVAVLSNLGIQCAGMTLNRFCSSGLQSIAIAANQIASGCSDIIVAGGVESITMTAKSRNSDNLFNTVRTKTCQDSEIHSVNPVFASHPCTYGHFSARVLNDRLHHGGGSR